MFGASPRLAIVIAVVVTAVTTALATFGATAVLGDADDVDAKPLPSTQQELEDQVMARLPEPAEGDWSRRLLIADHVDETLLAVPPGRYEVHVVCGLMSGQYLETKEVELTLRGSVRPDIRNIATFPCPSTPLTLDHELVFTEPGAIAVRLEAHRIPTGAVALMITGATDGQSVD